MLKHADSNTVARVVVLGSTGFVGRALLRRLRNADIPTLALGSHDLDLTAENAPDRLAAELRSDDALVFLAALTPDKGRDLRTFLRNIEIGRTVCFAMERVPLAHVVYVSSDAVYPFTGELINEASAAAPSDLYGTMHRTREVMVGSSTKAPFAILRPTQIYGREDTHNSYGPNRFIRTAMKDHRIVLGGGGEETRDHIWVEDVARLLELVLLRRSSGILNLATGRSTSFDAVAQAVAALFNNRPDIVYGERTVPVTHRSFDVSALLRAFPGIGLAPIVPGLRDAYSGLELGTNTPDQSAPS